MNFVDRYRKVFFEAFQGVDESNVELLEYQGIVEWDSIGHMNLISLLENEFGIMLEMDDVIDFASYVKGLQIIQKYLK